MEQKDRPLSSAKRNYLALLTAFSLLTLISLPILFSFDLWVFKDRGSFLNLDSLLARHWRLGVDTYYSYGLLPVSLQHLLFRAFGPGYWPLVGCTLVTLILMAGFWAGLLRHLPKSRIWLYVLVAISPILLWVNPNLPYSIVQLSLLFSLLCVLDERLNVAMAISVVGCFSVPSLPLALTSMLALAIVIEWWTQSNRSFLRLLSRLIPGIATYLAIAAVLIVSNGFQSVLATSIPLLGMRFYKAAHFDPLMTSVEFFFPQGHSLPYYFGYYVGTPVTWWFTSTLALFIFGFLAASRMIRQRKLDPRSLFIFLCAVLQALFTFAARGSVEQYIIYDPILVAGVLIGISDYSAVERRTRILIAFAVLSIFSEVKQGRTTVLAWRDMHPSPRTANLYAPRDMVDEWSHIVELSASRKLLLLSYGTGAHHYFPSVETADAWTLRTGQLFPADRERLLAKLQDADIVVEDLTGLTSAWASDPAIQSQLNSMCLTAYTTNFRTWWRRSATSEGVSCLVDQRHRSN